MNRAASPSTELIRCAGRLERAPFVAYMKRACGRLGLLLCATFCFMRGVALSAGEAAAPPRGVSPPAPFGPLPTERQLRWHAMEFYGFLHFTVNTFTDKEWGYGDEEEKVFNPTALDASQIVSVAKAAGMTGLILTAKHHDGFCLWPSAYTQHSVKNSPWRDGHGDVVKEISQACHRQGLKFGVYLSPWDRNSKVYGRPEYVEYYRNQLRELLKNYGDIFVVWFDGANGGDGFYGGSREVRHIDNRTYYDWKNTWELVRQLMPGAVMFSDAGPDVRWVGNERGVAGDPCWAPLLGHGERRGPVCRRHKRGPQLRRATRHRLDSGRVRRLDPSRLVLSSQRGQQGEIARAVARNLLRVGWARRLLEPEYSARPPGSNQRERYPIAQSISPTP
ncbi:hypothetical protein SBV1_1150002 [Verrucomicrobia bacterium]|nr:hypothetical protein SBV1_1150002 [Verrucomicrobiota bacterium]